MNGMVRESLQSYKRAFNLDETSVPALAGIIYCQIVDGQLSEAEQQLEFLAEARAYSKWPVFMNCAMHITPNSCLCHCKPQTN